MSQLNLDLGRRYKVKWGESLRPQHKRRHKNGRVPVFRSKTIETALRENGYSFSKAAKALGCCESVLRKRAQELCIDKKQLIIDNSGDLQDRLQGFYDSHVSLFNPYSKSRNGGYLPTRKSVADALGVSIHQIRQALGGIDDAWKRLEQSALQKIRDQYSPRLADVDKAVLDKACDGDIQAAKLAYERLEGWNSKAPGGGIDLPAIFDALSEAAPELAVELRVRVMAKAKKMELKSANPSRGAIAGGV